MFSWFKKNNVQDKDDEDEDEDYLRNLIYINEHVKFYKTNVRNFVPNIKLWSFQRPVNFDHVKELVESLKIKNHFIGTFKVIKDKDGKIRLIDGQHRYLAIKELMETDSKFNMDIIIEFYETDKIESEYSINLFNKANSCLNITENDLPNTITTAIVNNICEDFNGMIIDVKDMKTCNRPRINKKLLYLALKEYVEKIYNNEDEEQVIIDKIYQQIKNINITYGNRKRSSFKSVSETMYNKCIKSGLYLGLECNFEWMEKLEISK